MEISSRTAALLLLTLLTLSIGIISIPVFITQTGTNMEVASDFYADPSHDINTSIANKEFPVITAENQRIALNEEYDPMNWVSVLDAQDGDITSNVNVYGEVDNATKGDYEIRYSIRNSYGLRSTKKIRIIVD